MLRYSLWNNAQFGFALRILISRVLKTCYVSKHVTCQNNSNLTKIGFIWHSKNGLKFAFTRCWKVEKIGTSTLQKNCIKICSTSYTALLKVVKEVTAQLLRSIYQQHCCVTRFNQQLSKFNLWGLSNVLATEARMAKVHWLYGAYPRNE